ncbi:SET domain [Cordyceps militaris]|uniref:Histone-lysine N-methyltransferase SET9 n=1 Tax=Cordyceps militaris TaxID=73501 RepID=A0A2H4SPA1_CORMI|nr:SET domain [Cordyceps militaris]
MPPSKKVAPNPKRHVLTLAQLSAYDDILTDALVDHVYYWTTIPKNRPSYHPSRGVVEGTIAKILQDEVVLNKNPADAEAKLLATDGLRRFSAALKTDKERDDFRRHLRRYINIYLPDCPWEVNSTNRYTIVTHEASITARRPIRRNESIKYLSGMKVHITPEEEDLISNRKKDFSIVVSSRSKSTSLFMGPARFANHDCNANAALMTTSQAGIEIVAMRNIAVGEEITVTYGDNYFGQDNCECLCKTCEDERKNGWQNAQGKPTVKTVDEEGKTEAYVLRTRRRDDSICASSRTPSVTPTMRPKIRKTRTASRLQHDGSADSSAPSPAPELTPRTAKRSFDAMATPPVTPAKKLQHTVELVDAARDASRGSSVSDSFGSSQDGPLETDVSSPEPSSDKPSALAGPLSPNSSQGAPSPQKMDSDPTCISVQLLEDDAQDSITVSIEPADDSEKTDASRPPKRKYQRRVYREQTPPVRQRAHGDYVLTPLLLSEPASAWIQCGTCSTPFVQQNAYFTRAACPRCERHSKMYGYIWPKTDKEGPWDKEERVLDHRTVHRFLDTYEEKRARGRKVGSEPRETEEEVPSRGRTLKRKPLTKPAAKPKAVPKRGGGFRRSGRTRTMSSDAVARAPNAVAEASDALANAIDKEENVLFSMRYPELQKQFYASILEQTVELEDMICRLLQVQECKIHRQPRAWMHGSFNVAIIVWLPSGKAAYLRLPFSHRIGEGPFPGNLEEKIRTETATYLWLQEHCPDVPIPTLIHVLKILLGGAELGHDSAGSLHVFLATLRDKCNLTGKPLA